MVERRCRIMAATTNPMTMPTESASRSPHSHDRPGTYRWRISINPPNANINSANMMFLLKPPGKLRKPTNVSALKAAA